MDDSCAVCAEPLEWVAYGPCGHRDVCSTCVARLRFILDDRKCCICKTDCNVVFVTKAMGDYTKMIDFSTLPSELRDGKVGRYWYHEDMHAFFDDIDQYKMIKAMCKLSCSLCDKADEQPDANQRRRRFRNIDQLKGHLYHQHKLHMCSLCLEGRKVFICEQKLYTRAQLDQHIRTGDSEVDGTESERGGFTGHPKCEFCRTPFYGDNELYTHMTTEHYTCHICQRQNPGHYEYYRNYDDLETHFGQAHFLCEDEACLAKKFVVFQSEAEFKRHNALEHGGHMSRSKRNAALQIPTSFRYRSGNDAGASRGRGRGSFRRESSPDNQLTQAIHASLETVDTDGRAPRASSVAEVSDVAEESYADPLIQPFESLATTNDSELPSRYREALSQNSRNTLGESYFPPLSTTASGSSQQRTQIESNGSTQNTMASRLRRKNNIKVLNTSQAWPPTSRQPVALSSIPVQPQPVVMNTSRASASSSGAATPAATNDPLSSTTAKGPPVSSSSYASSVLTRPKSNHGLEFGASSTSRVHRSSSASNLVGNVSYNPVSDFPSISEMKSNPPPPSSSAPLKVDDVQTANKSLIEMIRSSLDDDEDKYANFKYISQEYRQGSVDTWSYFQYVKQFGLSHLMLDLARLCPDPQKQKELLEMHNASLRGNKSEETFWGNSKQSASSSKAKEKVVDKKKSTKDTLADNIIDTVRKLRSEMKSVQGEVEVLEKDGYRSSKGKSIISMEEKPIVIREPVVTLKEPPPANSDAGDGGGNKKGKKKTSKFHRNRLGDDYAGSSLDARSSTADESADLKHGTGQSSLSGLPARGVWKNGGGQKLFTAASRK